MSAIKTTTTVDIDWYQLGQQLAREQSGQQAAFLDGFARGLRNFGTVAAALQIEYIANDVRHDVGWLAEELHVRLNGNQP